MNEAKKERIKLNKHAHNDWATVYFIILIRHTASNPDIWSSVTTKNWRPQNVVRSIKSINVTETYTKRVTFTSFEVITSFGFSKNKLYTSKSINEWTNGWMNEQSNEYECNERLNCWTQTDGIDIIWMRKKGKAKGWFQ